MARKIPTSKAEDAQQGAQGGLMSAMCSAPVPSGIEVSEPKRLIDIDLFRFGMVRSQVLHMRDSTPLVRSVTLDEAGAKKLMHELIKALI